MWTLADPPIPEDMPPGCLIAVADAFIDSLPHVASGVNFPTIPTNSPSSLVLSTTKFLPVVWTRR